MELTSSWTRKEQNQPTPREIPKKEAGARKLGKLSKHSALNLARIKMAFIIRNYMDLYVQNGVVELGAGLAAFLLPNLFFPHTKTNPHATMIARWWSAAVIGLGLTSLLVSTRTLHFTAFASDRTRL